MPVDRATTPDDPSAAKAEPNVSLTAIRSPKRSIRRRLHRLVVLSVGVALVCSAILSVWQSTTTYLSDKRESLLATANVIAGTSSRAVATADITLIKDSLRSISRLPQVAYAQIENRDGQVLSQVGGAVHLSSDLALDQREKDSLYTFLRTRTVQVSVPIVYGGDIVGRVVLVSNTGDLLTRFLGVFAIASLGALLAVGVGLSIAHRLQRSITLPLGLLATDMERIARTQDYSASVPMTDDIETEQLASTFTVMMGEIQKTSVALSNREAELIFRLSRATEKRDNETGGHILRMAALCRLVAEGLNLNKHEIEAIHRVAPLHDVGKIAVSDAIMFKPGKLDPAERREMEQHTTYGYEILRDSESDLVTLAAEMAWSHHERWDGLGYPRGLKGNDIPLAGRIAAVADVCDALASERPYKPAWSLDAVKAHLIANSGTHFDPACVESLFSRWDAVEVLYASPVKATEAHNLRIAS
jgi:HD-GYP domain-containing protein (c-di-GMP phosphodiesterase class II)